MELKINITETTETTTKISEPSAVMESLKTLTGALKSAATESETVTAFMNVIENDTIKNLADALDIDAAMAAEAKLAERAAEKAKKDEVRSNIVNVINSSNKTDVAICFGLKGYLMNSKKYRQFIDALINYIMSDNTEDDRLDFVAGIALSGTSDPDGLFDEVNKFIGICELFPTTTKLEFVKSRLNKLMGQA